MISLEQVRQLDIRVKKAVTALKNVSAENSALKAEIAELKTKLDELNTEAAGRKADEQELEVSLQGVLDVLDEVDGETSEVEPEPPADNYVVETAAPDDEPAEETEETEEPAIAAVPEGNESVSAPEEANEPEDQTGSLFDDQAPEAPAVEPAAREAEQAPAAAESVSEEVPGVGQVVEFTSPADSPENSTPENDTAVGDAAAPDAPEVDEVDLKQPPEEPGLDGDSVDDEFGTEFDIF